MLMLLMFVMIFIFGDPNIRSVIALSLNSIFYPIIGFGGNYPLLTIFLAGILVVFLSSFFTNLFTDWKAMGKAQEALHRAGTSYKSLQLSYTASSGLSQTR